MYFSMKSNSKYGLGREIFEFKFNFPLKLKNNRARGRETHELHQYSGKTRTKERGEGGQKKKGRKLRSRTGRYLLPNNERTAKFSIQSKCIRRAAQKSRARFWGSASIVWYT